MTLYELEVFIHHHASLARFPRADAPLYIPTINKLMEAGLLDFADGIARQTDKGAAFAAMLQDTPLPKQVCLDPRTNAIIRPPA